MAKPKKQKANPLIVPYLKIFPGPDGNAVFIQGLYLRMPS